MIEAALAGKPVNELMRAAMQAKHGLLETFTATPYRPTGASAPDEALANAVELLEWCTGLVGDMVGERADLSATGETEREILTAAAGLLRGAASPTGELDSGSRSLDRARERTAHVSGSCRPISRATPPTRARCFTPT